MLKRLKNEQGFTIQELVVVLAVGSLLFIFSNITFSFIQRTYLTWTGRIEQQDDLVRTSLQMTKDIQLSEEILAQDDSTLILVTAGEDTIEYHIRSGLVFRNDMMILKSDSLRLTVQAYADSASAKQKIDLHLSGKSPNYTTVKSTSENLRGEKQRFKHHLF
ncbi:MAG: hypothetical protein WDA22_01535 [Bacteroidota bacterium]